MNETEVKTEAAEQKTEEAKTYSEEQFKGLLADKQSEVKKRQQVEQQLAEVMAEKGQSKTPPSGESEGSSEDRPMTVGQFKKMMAEERKTNADADFELRHARSKEAAVKEYTAEKCGQGLDFETVIADGEISLTEGDRLAIRQAEDPAAEKYRRCVMLTPQLSEKAQAFQNSGMLEKIRLTGKVPATGGSAETTATETDVSNMSDEELDKIAEQL